MVDNWSLVGLLVILAISCFYAAAYFSLRDFSRIRLEEILQRKNKPQRFDYLQDHLDSLLLICSVIRTAANIALVSLLVWVAAFEPLEPISLIYAFLISLLLLIFFSVALPHAWARHAAEPFLARIIPVLYVTEKISLPLSALLYVSDVLIRRLLGASAEPQNEEHVQQEILEAVHEGEDEGVVDTQERKMIESVIELRSTMVGNIMTPRTEIIAIEAKASLDEIKKVIMDHGHSRMPIYEENLDNIIGMLYVKDLLRYIGESIESFHLREIMRQCYFVPETKNLREIFSEFRNKKLHVAVVLDEYGGTLGLVTFEDVLEQIVGQIADEYELAEPPLIRQIDATTLEADGRMRIDELNDDYNLAIPESEDYETVSGFLFSSLGRIPLTGEAFEFMNIRFTILDATERKINRTLLEILPQHSQRAEERTR